MLRCRSPLLAAGRAVHLWSPPPWPLPVFGSERHRRSSPLSAASRVARLPLPPGLLLRPTLPCPLLGRSAAPRSSDEPT